VERSIRLVDRLIIAILSNEQKEALFSVEERMAMVREVVGSNPNVEVASFHGLLVDFAAQQHANVIIRGIRAVSDYEYELQMALMNRKLRPDLETVFMMPAEQYSYLSSRLVRELAQLNGSIEGLVPAMVEQRLKEKLDPAIKFQHAREPKSRKSG